MPKLSAIVKAAQDKPAPSQRSKNKNGKGRSAANYAAMFAKLRKTGAYRKKLDPNAKKGKR
jgi:hypothetical protein